MTTRSILLLFLALPPTAHAQLESAADAPPRLWFVGGNVNARQSQTESLSNFGLVSESKWLNANLYVGKSLNDRWAMGGVLSYNFQDQTNNNDGVTTPSSWTTRTFGPAVFVRYTSVSRAGFQGFLQPQVGFEMSSSDIRGFGVRRSNGYLLGSQVSGGMLYEVNSRLRLRLRLATIGYAFGRDQSDAVRNRKSEFIFNSALSSIGFGLEWKW